MLKLKRYLGLALAIALLVFAFLPVGNSSFRFKPLPVTPLDDTVLAHVTNVGGRSSELWMAFSRHIEECAAFRANPNRMDVSCRQNDNLFFRLTKLYAAEIRAVEPKVDEFVAEYSAARAAEKPQTVPSVSSFGRPQVVLSERMTKAERQVGGAIAKYLDAQRSTMATAVYLAHGLAILAFVVLVISRESVGALLLWPFSLLFGAAKAGGKAAKSIHDKV